MRTFLFCLSFIVASPSFAQVSLSPTRPPSPPLISNEGGIAIAQMILENSEGVALLKKVHHTGPLITSGKVEIISQTKDTDENGSPLWTTVTEFTLQALDCLGTDACEGRYLWIATATMISSGYTYTTTYTNTVTPFKRQPFPASAPKD